MTTLKGGQSVSAAQIGKNQDSSEKKLFNTCPSLIWISVLKHKLLIGETYIVRFPDSLGSHKRGRNQTRITLKM